MLLLLVLVAGRQTPAVLLLWQWRQTEEPNCSQGCRRMGRGQAAGSATDLDGRADAEAEAGKQWVHTAGMHKTR